MKKKSKVIALIIASVFIYEVAGACLPFAFTKKVNKDKAEEIEKTSFYGNGTQNERAGIVETNKDALTTRLAMFEEAKKSIIISTFDIREGKSTSDIFASLLSAADRGVKVRVLVDGMYGLLHMNRKAIFQAAGSHPNLEIRFYNTPNPLLPWTINGRMHDKYVVVDEKLLLMGGRNMFDYFIGDYPNKSKGYDREVLVYDAAGEEREDKTGSITQVSEYFEQIWKLSCCKTVFNKMDEKDESYKEETDQLLKRYQKIKKEMQLNPNSDWNVRTVPIERATFVTNPVHIGSKEPVVWHTMQELMAQAKQKVVIQTPYAVFSKDMYEGMREVSQKVPQVDMLINSAAVGDNLMASSDYTWNKKKVRDTGVKVWEYQGGHSCHGKSLIIDNDISVVGSYNFDMRSTYVDTETMLVIHGNEFHSLLQEKMEEIQELSLEVGEDGAYIAKEEVPQAQIPKRKSVLIHILSLFIQAFRYLV